jgi:hypothetical protein
MRGAVWQRSFHMSHDGKTVLAHSFGGFTIIQGSNCRDYTVMFRPGFRVVQWAPDSKHFMFWVPSGLAVADLDDLGAPNGPPNYKVIYKAPKDRFPFGSGWAPSGNEVFVIENYIEPDERKKGEQLHGTAIKRVPAGGGGSPVEILHHPTDVKFFMTPETRFTYGQGPNQNPFLIVFGAKDGLYVMDPNGKNKELVCDFQADGVNDVLWSPGPKDKVIVMFRQMTPTVSGKALLKGVYLLHLDRRGKKGADVVEQLTDALDVHTQWFTKSGKYFSWSTADEVAFRDPDGKPDSVVHIARKDFGNLGELPIKGFSWNLAETMLAIAAGNRIYVYDVAKKTMTQRLKVGDEQKTFVAEPFWEGDDVVYTTYTNIAADSENNAPKKLK